MSERVCIVCLESFDRAPKSKRVTCSRSCAVALAWAKNPEQRCASISIAHQRPEAQLRLAAHNKRRWAKPEEHEKIAEESRQRWADKDMRREMRDKMRETQRSPRMRRLYSVNMQLRWDDPEWKAKTLAAINSSEAVRAYRNSFGDHLRERWKKPRLRRKYTKANIERNRQRAERAKQ